MARSVNQRTVRSAVVAIALVSSLGGGWVSAPTAFAAGDPHAFFYSGKATCSTSKDFPRIGSARFSRSGNDFTLIVKLRGADADTTYLITMSWISDANNCSALFDFGQITTDASGNAGPETFTHSSINSATVFVADLSSECGPSSICYSFTTPVTLKG